MMAFIDDDSLLGDSLKDDDPQEMASSMLHRTSHSRSSSPFYNGWSNSSSSSSSCNKRGHDVQSRDMRGASSLPSPNANYNNNNNNNNNGNNNNNNNNVGYAVVKENTYSPPASAAGHGSPLRTGLNLQLSSHTSPKPRLFDCPMCPYNSDCHLRLEEHINRQHFDLTSPSLPPESFTEHDENVFSCPLCITTFKNSSDLELHVNIEHKDILSPSSNGASSKSDIPLNIDIDISCPVCSSTSFTTREELTFHIEEHFSKNGTPSPITPDSSSDRMLARDMERQGRERDKEVMRLREQREFEMLRAQYGMDNQGNFREQSVTNMQRAVYAGEMSVADFYERQIELKAAEHNGIDDGSSCTRGKYIFYFVFSSSRVMK